MIKSDNSKLKEFMVFYFSHGSKNGEQIWESFKQTMLLVL